VALTMFGGPLSRKVPETRTFTVEGPAHSLLLEPFTRRVRAEVDGVTVLDTVRGALLFETGLPPQLYVPEEDLRADLLEPSDTTTHCPFKGDATYRSLRVGDRVVPDAVWAYPTPIAESSWLAGRAVRSAAAALLPPEYQRGARANGEDHLPGDHPPGAMRADLHADPVSVGRG